MKYVGMIIVCFLMIGCQSKAQDHIDKQLQKSEFTVQKTDQQWREDLTPKQYQVLRKAATEQRYTSPILNIEKPGTLVCAACGNPVFNVKNKYDAKCGWPSFDRAIKGSVVYQKDFKIGYERTEVLCAKCGSHLGHVFDDGPKETTGERYCISGIALKYIAKK